MLERRTKIGKYRNKSKIFLLPLLDIRLSHGTENSDYLIDVNFIKSEKQIILIFDNFDYEPLKMDLYKLTVNPYYIDAFYSEDNSEICFQFKVSPRLEDDFNLFIEGKYSEFSATYKSILTKYYGDKRAEGINSKGLPNVSIYDVINPLNSTKKLFADQLKVELKYIKEVLDPPKIEFEEFKKLEELHDETR